MKSFIALISRIFSTVILGLGAILIAVWVIAAIISLVVFLAAAVVCTIPLIIGVQFQNWAAQLEGRQPMQVGDGLARLNDLFDKSRLH